VKLIVPFQESADFLHHLAGRSLRNSERHVRAIELNRFVALMVESAGGARRD
jgi:hypothetical protein